MERVVYIVLRRTAGHRVANDNTWQSMLNCSSGHNTGFCVLLTKHDAIQLHSDQSGKHLFLLLTAWLVIVRSLIKCIIIPVGRFC